MTDNPDPVVVKDLRLERAGETQCLSASVDGTEIWFRTSADLPLARRAEAFLAPALFEAMVRNAPVRVEGAPVSPMLLRGLSSVQTIFRSWNRDLHVVEIEADESEPEIGTGSAICCFSGGVDSSYTLACHEQDVSHLLLVEGFDTYNLPADWEENKKARSRFARIAGKKLIAVDSNIRDFVETRKVYWGLVIGSVLAGLGVSLAPRMFLMPSSWTYQNLHPYGSHPLIDPLWSTESTCVVHHGADTRRSQKVERIAESRELLDQLQVCWRSCSSNCGTCPKCVRTSLVLHLIGKRSANLPPYSSQRLLGALKPDGEGTLPYVEDLILACRRHGASDIQRQLQKMRRRYLLREAVVGFGKALTGAWGRSLHRRLRPRQWHAMRATLRSAASPF